jgi:hypothetical protein
LSSVKLEHWAPERLVGYARSPRKNDAVVDRMAEAIREFGFRTRSQAPGLASVPVVLADDLSEAQIKAFRLLANRSATWAEWDDELLALELSDLTEANFDLGLTGFESPEIEELLSLLDPVADAPEAEDEDRWRRIRLVSDANLAALTDLSGAWIDRVHRRRPTERHHPRHGQLREPERSGNRKARLGTATSAVPATTLCSCSTSSAISSAPCSGPATFTGLRAGVRCSSR